MTSRSRDRCAEGARPVVGIVLAGGASRRFGSDKLAADLDGRPLVLHAIEAVRSVAAVGGIVVVGPAEPAEPDWLASVEAPGVEVVRDEEAFGGPLAGLAVALGELPDEAVALVVGGDMPSVDATLLADLVRAFGGGAIRMACLEAGGAIVPLPFAVAVAPAHDVATALLASGERRLRAFVAAFDDRATLAADPRSLVDVDTRRDLERLRT